MVTGEAIVTVTDKAAEKARAILSERGVEGGALRVFVAGGGCSGYQYGMSIARNAEDGDISIQAEGITILIDEESAPLISGAEVDYVDDIMKSGFTIFNPNATKSCACGTSFQTADGSGSAKACC